ncbi:MAG: peptidoglycan DD-metalloendopeptidase family protein [bacterium]
MIAFWRENSYDILLLKTVVLFLAALFSSPGYAANKKDSLQQQINQAQGKVKAIEQQIRESENRLKKTRAGEEEVLRKIELCDQLAEKYKYKRAILDDKINSVKLKQEELSLEINREQGSVARQKNLLALRLRSVYQAGPLRFWRVILGAESMTELWRKVSYMKLIAEEDSRLIQRFSHQIEELKIKKEKMYLHQQEIEELQKSAAEQERAWIQKKNEKEKHLKALRARENEYRLAHQGLSNRLNDLQALLTDLEKKRRLQQIKPSPASGFAARRGKLPWPVQGKIVSSSPFGKQPTGTAGNATWRKGVTIQAPAGKEICSIYPGRVAYADWCLGYGKLLIVDHGEGYCSVYAHASELLVNSGDSVQEKQPIARIGDTGGVSSPQVYFEIRFRGNPVDPLIWLQ